MKPRFVADYRMLLWMLVLMPSLPVAMLVRPSLGPWLLPFGLYFAYCTGIATHCHNHCPVFSRRRVNQGYALWLSAVYGYPSFAWVPTHNQNHHKFTNGEGDATRTSRYAPRNTLWYALTYPVASAIHQAPHIAAYVRAARSANPKRFAQICMQYAAVALAHAAFVCTAMGLHGVRSGLSCYVFGLAIPAGFALWSMMFTNFVQHVGCDASSADNHSRNFVNRTLNWFVFDAGYHSVHHENPGLHWSRYRQLHQERAAAIAPELNQASIFGYCWSSYVLEPLRGLAASSHLSTS